MTQPLGNHNLHLTMGHVLARNAIWNLIGSGAPMLVAIVAIPVLIKGLGTDRFGVLALAWALIGYATVFDLGLGRALTQLVAKKLGAGEEHEVPALVWTALFLMFLLCLVGAVVVVLLSPWLVKSGLNVPGTLQRETLHTFYLLGLSIPVVTSTAGLRGLLEAKQRFDLVNTLRVPMGVFMFVGPLIVLPFSKNLFSMVAVLVAGRLVAWGAHLLVCLKVTPALGDRITWQRNAAGLLLRFGGWMTVSNIVGPLMVTLDRFLIGALLSVGAVSYYATPFEVVTKFLLIPGAVVSVMFPAFSMTFVHNSSRAALLFSRSIKYLLVVLFPLLLLAVVLAHDGLRLWLGAEFAQHSTRVLQWLAVGVFVNSLALVPVALVQGAGRADLTAKLHLAELPIYLLAVWGMIVVRGIEGAAIAWAGRAAVDAIILFALAKWLLPMGAFVTPRNVLLLVLAVLFLVTAVLLQGLIVKGLFLSATLLGFAFAIRFLIFGPKERTLVQDCR